jgi:uncharacterized protein YabN with tetrapyrrole methylase and pyrophosphatase domain
MNCPDGENPFWQEIKANEAKKKNNRTFFDSISKSQPSLSRSYKMGEKAATVNFLIGLTLNQR